MKKLLTMMLMLVAGTAMSFAAKTIYLNATNWAADNAKFAVYSWGDDLAGSWTAFTAVEGEVNIYKVALDDKATKMILGRFAPATEVYQFDVPSLWNRAGDITEGIADGNMFTPNAGSDSWTYSTPVKPYACYVAGNGEITKNDEVWTAPSTNNIMTSSSDVAYTLTVENKLISAGTYDFKIVVKQNEEDASSAFKWYPATVENAHVVIENDGYYDIVFTYCYMSNTVNAVATVKSLAPITYRYFLEEYTTDFTEIGELTTATEGENAGKFAALTIERTFDAILTLKYKIAKRKYANGEYVSEVWLGANDTSVDENYNLGFTPEKATKYGITFNIWFENDNIWTDAEEKITGYYLITDEGAEKSWIKGDALAEDEGVYSISFSKEGKMFAIAPSTAINAEGNFAADAAAWAKVIRPVTAGADWAVNYFVNYSGTTQSVAENGKVWAVADGNTSTLTLAYTPAENTFAVTTNATETVNIGATGYATYSNDVKYKVEGATANFVTVEGSVATLVPLAAGAVLPNKTVTNEAGKNSGVILTGSGEVTIKPVDMNAEVVAGVSSNLMAGSGNASYNIATQFGEGDTYTGYVLFKDETNPLGFYKVKSDANTLAAHKAFLAVPKGGATAPEFIGFGETTGISEELRVKSEGFATAPVYNLAGQRVAQPTKGLYIVNGKKVVIK